MKDGKVLRDRALAGSILSDKMFRGSVGWWVPHIETLALEKHKWRRLWISWLNPNTYLPQSAVDFAGQISRLVTFDFLINNQDRFSGANVLVTPGGNRLYFMDNALAFFPDITSPKRSRARREFYRAGRFSQLLHERIHLLNLKNLKTQIIDKEENVSWTFLMTKDEFKGVLERRDLIITRMHEMAIRHGWDKTMAFP